MLDRGLLSSVQATSGFPPRTMHTRNDTRYTSPNLRHPQVRCSKAGKPKEVLSLATEALPGELEWGQVLLSMRVVPINPADLYTVSTGGLYGSEAVAPPFVAGHDGVAVVVKV